MTSALKCAMTFLCLASVPFVLFLANFSYPLTVAKDNNINLLKYEVNDVYVGKLKHTIEIYNNAFVEIRGGKLLVPIIRN
ncbi:MAG: hypothetical protein OEZ21_11405, partial [Candidatus Bathyarchaeota archaeon]|nr:hypothetical protein [Candidatus Bathyarchaeota archaeon]